MRFVARRDMVWLKNVHARRSRVSTACIPPLRERARTARRRRSGIRVNARIRDSDGCHFFLDCIQGPTTRPADRWRADRGARRLTGDATLRRWLILRQR